MKITKETQTLPLPNGESITWRPYNYEYLDCDCAAPGTVRVELHDRTHKVMDELVSCSNCLKNAIHVLTNISFKYHPVNPGDTDATITYEPNGNLLIQWCPIHWIRSITEHDEYFLPTGEVFTGFSAALNGMRDNYRLLTQAAYGHQEHHCTTPEPILELEIEFND